MVPGSLHTGGGLTPLAGTMPNHPRPHGPTPQPGRGSTRRVWGASWCCGVCRGSAGGVAWPDIGDRVKPPPRVPALLLARGSQAGSAPHLYLFIYR